MSINIIFLFINLLNLRAYSCYEDLLTYEGLICLPRVLEEHLAFMERSIVLCCAIC